MQYEKFEVLEQEVKNLREALETVSMELMRPQRRITTDSMFSEDDIFPIKTFAKMNFFEERLKNDKSLRQSLVSYFQIDFKSFF